MTKQLQVLSKLCSCMGFKLAARYNRGFRIKHEKLYQFGASSLLNPWYVTDGPEKYTEAKTLCQQHPAGGV